MIQSFTFGPFATHTYLYIVGTDAVLIDPAAFDMFERDELAKAVDQSGATLRAIIATHGHLDHLWAAKWATERWGLPLLIHEKDFTQIEHLARQQENFGLIPRETDFAYQALSASADLPLLGRGTGGGLILTPGHTQGSVCLYDREAGILFSGDTLFDGGYGRTDLPGGNYMQLMDSLDRLSTLIPAGTTVYPGHGSSFVI